MWVGEREREKGGGLDGRGGVTMRGERMMDLVRFSCFIPLFMSSFHCSSSVSRAEPRWMSVQPVQ